jgi:hypothetical protein
MVRAAAGQLFDFRPALAAHIFRLLRSPGNERELQEIFSFLDDVARSGSFALLDVLQIEIVTPLAGSKTERELASKFMGTTLRQLVEKSGKWDFRLWLASLMSCCLTNRAR